MDTLLLRLFQENKAQAYITGNRKGSDLEFLLHLLEISEHQIALQTCHRLEFFYAHQQVIQQALVIPTLNMDRPLQQMAPEPIFRRGERHDPVLHADKVSGSL